MQNKYKKLLSNSFLFMIAQFGSKVLMFIVVPLYTFLLTTNEYGVIELSTTTLTIAAPCCMLLIYDAVLRFSMTPDIPKEFILTSSIKVFLVGSFFALIVIPATKWIDSLSEYSVLIYFLIISYGLYYIVSQFAKGINVKIFVLCGILFTITFLGCNLFFIVLLKKGVWGYILSQIIGYIFSTLFVCLKLKIWKYIDLHIDTRAISKEMLQYSVLLIPNALVWWIIASANRYYIEVYLGSDANGIYGIAAKIPNIITMVGTIFIQAWQLSAIDEKEQNNNASSRKYFFTNVFGVYSCVLVLSSSLLIIICRPCLSIILSSSFYSAWKYVPILLVSSIYMMYAQYWSSLFIAEKSSKELSSSSIISGILSLLLNWILIPKLGLMGAVIVCLISCFIMWVLRVISARRYDMISINYKREVIALTTLIIQCIISLRCTNVISYIINISLFMIQTISYKSEITGMIKVGKSVIQKISRR